MLDKIKIMNGLKQTHMNQSGQHKSLNKTNEAYKAAYLCIIKILNFQMILQQF